MRLQEDPTTRPPVMKNRQDYCLCTLQQKLSRGLYVNSWSRDPPSIPTECALTAPGGELEGGPDFFVPRTLAIEAAGTELADDLPCEGMREILLHCSEGTPSLLAPLTHASLPTDVRSRHALRHGVSTAKVWIPCACLRNPPCDRNASGTTMMTLTLAIWGMGKRWSFYGASTTGKA